jgi:excisionase family DNA binding protein
MNNQILLSRNQAAEMLNIGVTTLWRLTKKGQIPAVKIGSRCLYHRDSLIQFAEGEMHATGSMGAD